MKQQKQSYGVPLFAFEACAILMLFPGIPGRWKPNCRVWRISTRRAGPTHLAVCILPESTSSQRTRPTTDQQSTISSSSLLMANPTRPSQAPMLSTRATWTTLLVRLCKICMSSPEELASIRCGRRLIQFQARQCCDSGPAGSGQHITTSSERSAASPTDLETYVITVGDNLNYTEVEAIATNPGPGSDHIIPVPDFSSMDSVVDQIVAATCAASGELDLTFSHIRQRLMYMQAEVVLSDPETKLCCWLHMKTFAHCSTTFQALCLWRALLDIYWVCVCCLFDFY